MNINDKERLRRRLIDKRLLLSESDRQERSDRALEFVRALPEWLEAAEVLLYWPVRGEVNVRPLLDELWERGARVLLPRCRPERNGEMDIACAVCRDDLAPGPFAIMEPDATKCPAMSECCPDLALIPGIGFDRRGFRLGFGGGYYDRLLANGAMQATLTIGMGYEFQLVDRIPTEEWDMPVKAVCTDEELWRP
ncbi:5-formyltetrahydrofolate cyclo-ligase [Pseudodesulfovibrio cashew]|uniref:5-formyltetrahydrofolate cyclo-ligase n=1 Tax=Pseudodesulfovibrio cashew TaxID=2678688 RepID=A0A6I6JF47_9BACT|nr:5-formyltetrahydrofolate cyclo-ligase [Pseudodesulfovibrio cashew]QGY39153.1 5-formyltetrahydrofolate cyclo-ligase [Pseudodesulfovibrio cashew]